MTQFFSNCISFGAIWKHNLLEDLHGIEQNQCQLSGKVRFQYVKVSNMKLCISDLVQKKVSQKVIKEMFHSKELCFEYYIPWIFSNYFFSILIHYKSI